MADTESFLEDLVLANRVLLAQNILQEAGSVSVRNPNDASTFFTSDVPASLITSEQDLCKRNVADCKLSANADETATSTRSDTSWTEPLIHSSIYARFSDVQSVIHAESLDAIVFSLCDASGSMMLPAHNKAGFVGNYMPIFDPADAYSAIPGSHPRDLRISHPALGKAMSRRLQDKENGIKNSADLPVYGCVLIRGNGVALWGRNLYEAVHKAIHLHRNAAIQTAAMLQRTNSDLEVTYLTDREAMESEASTLEASEILWKAWVAKIRGGHNIR